MWKYTPLGNTSLPNNVGGQGRRLIITHFSTKRNRNGRIAAARGRKPLPMGEVALRSNDGEGKPVSREPLRSDKQALRQSDAIAALMILCQRPCPLRRFAPAPPKGEPWALRDAKASPFGRGVTEGDGEGKAVSREPPRSDKQALRQSDTIAALMILCQRPCPLRRFAPAPPRGEPLAKGRGGNRNRDGEGYRA